jgi:guanine deaminase
MSVERFLCQAIELAKDNIREGGRPFAAVVVKDGEVIATGVNETHRSNDPTDHAELVALKKATRALGSPRLDGCEVYASGHPCPMCYGAMRLLGVSSVAHAYSQQDGEPYSLSTASIYAEMTRPLSEGAMKFAHVPVQNASSENIYAMWAEQNKSREKPAT